MHIKFAHLSRHFQVLVLLGISIKQLCFGSTFHEIMAGHRQGHEEGNVNVTGKDWRRFLL